MATVAEMMVRISADVSGLTSGIGQAEQSVSKFSGGTLTASKAIVGGFVAAGAAAAAFGIKAVTMAANMEQTAVSFKVMLGNADLATQTLKDLQTFAKTTPFEFPEVANAAKKLLAFGVAAKDLQPTLRSLGDIASGIGIPIGELSELYGKAKVQGRLFAEDVNQLTGRGIPIIQQFAKQFGVSESAVKGLVEQGKIGFPELQKAFQDMTAQGSQFGGMMEEQSKTMAGIWSNLKDNVTMSMVGIGTAITNAFNLKPILSNLADFTGKFAAAFATPESMKETMATLEKWSPLIGIVAGAITGVLVGALYMLAGAFYALVPAVWAAMAPFLPFMAIGAIIGGVVAAGILLYKNWDTIKAKAAEVWNGIMNFFATLPARMGSIMANLANGAVYWMGYMAGAIIRAIINLPSTIVNIFNTAVSWSINALRNLYSWAVSIASSMVNGISYTISNLPSIFYNIWNRIISFVSGLPGQLYNRAYSIASNFWSGFKRGLGIYSPDYISTAFANIAANAQNMVGDLKALVPKFDATVAGFGAPALAGIPGAGTPYAAAGSPRVTANTENLSINVGTLAVREEADIDRVAQRLYQLQRTQNRAVGR